LPSDAGEASDDDSAPSVNGKNESTEESDNSEGKSDSNSEASAEEGELESGETKEKPKKQQRQQQQSQRAMGVLKSSSSLAASTTNEKKLKKLKIEQDDYKRKLSKINRRINLFGESDSKAQAKKLKKYRQKVEERLERIELKIKSIRSAQLQSSRSANEVTRAKQQSLEKRKHKARQAEVAGSQFDSDESESSKQETQRSSKRIKYGPDVEPKYAQSGKKLAQETTPTTSTSQALSSPVLKLPYPVLNDKRNMSVVHSTLESKLNELCQKIKANNRNVEAALVELENSQEHLNLATSNKNQKVLEKLRQLESAYQMQKEKLEMQLDYVRLSLNADALRTRISTNPALMITDGPALAQIELNLNTIYAYMREENKAYLCRHQQQAHPQQQQPSSPHQSSEPPRASSPSSSNPQVSQLNATAKAALQKAKSPMDRINALHELVNSSLAAVIAHTAASAHVSAALNANYYYYYYKYYDQSKQGENVNSDTKSTACTYVPQKDELEKASSVFTMYKNKISNFFDLVNKKASIENCEDKEKYKASEVILVNDYSEAEEDNNHSSSNISKDATQKSKENASNTDDDDGDDDYDEGDRDNNYDLDIYTTSELRHMRLNFLTPSLKASYFPLKASMDHSNIQVTRKSNSLIAIEKSKKALTFLGAPSSMNFGGGIVLQSRPKLSDILYMNGI
jgi:hypothetical protein